MPEASSLIKVVDVNGVKRVEFSDRKILDELSINRINLFSKFLKTHLQNRS